MHQFDPKKMTIPEVHGFLIGCVGPRPIALVSTLSETAVPNLAPFSFFNAFGANPPTVAFSPARRGRDGTLKDTYNNLMASKECVVHAVTHAMVEQVNLASTEFGPEVNEFIKSGLTPIDSVMVKPKRVKESPFHMECKLQQMVHLGEGKGSGNLAICEVVMFHIAEDILADGKVRTDQIDLVARMGGEFWARASGKALFQVAKAVSEKSVGYDGLPDSMKKSHVYTANNLGRFGNCEKIPSKDEVLKWIEKIEPMKDASEALFFRHFRRQDYQQMLRVAVSLAKHPKAQFFAENTAKCALENGDIDFAWKVAVYAGL